MLFRSLKIIGLFYLLGNFGHFKASRDILLFASGIDEHEFDSAIANLRKRSVITERRYNDTFAIWEGSDVDIDGRFLEATKNVPEDVSLAESLRAHFNHQPIVAKRHSAKTGTLRFFEVAFVDAMDGRLGDEPARIDADGKILFVLASTPAQREIGRAHV